MLPNKAVNCIAKQPLAVWTALRHNDGRMSMYRHLLLATTIVICGCGSPTPEPGPALHPDFPVVEGEYQMTKDWFITLPGKFNRRLNKDQLVIWRPGITIIVFVWNNDLDESQDQRLAYIKRQMSKQAFGAERVMDGKMLRYAYRLTENRDEGVVHALYAYGIGENGHVQAVFYVEDETDLEMARNIWRSLTERSDAETDPSARPRN